LSTLITIDLDALQANFRSCQERLQPALCAAVVKADAYGLGIRRIAPALSHAGCRQFFTATHREGIHLRSLLPEAEVFVFEGVTRANAGLFREHGLVPVLITPAQAAAWADQARTESRPLPAIIDIDTGMTRLGFGEAELQQLLDRRDDLELLDLRYVMTHFACADDPESDMLSEQLDRFDRLRSLLPDAPTSIGNSAGALLGPESSGDMARLGIVLYGGNPYAVGEPPLTAVLRVQSRILQVREIGRETPVGYGATYMARPGTRIATVGTGYADGYPRSLSNRGIAAIGGHRVPVVGRISMDLITLDVTGLPDHLVKPGQLVDLIGPDVTLEEVAERAGTINHEILTGLSQRASRVFLGGPG
jgi:alanine racemase